MRVAMVVSQFRPLIGGTEMQAELLSQALISKGLDVTIISPASLFCPGKLPEDKVPVKRLRIPKIRGIKQLLSRKVLYDYLISRKADFDIIHIHHIGDHTYSAVKAAKIKKIPAIVKCANSGVFEDLDNEYPWVLKYYGQRMVDRIVDRAKCFIMLNEGMYKKLRERGVDEKKLKYIPNGVTIEPEIKEQEKKILRKKLSVCEDEVMFLSVGSLRPVKGYHTMLKALRLCKDSVKFKFFVLGKGKLLSFLVGEAERLGIKDEVCFVGEVPGGKLKEYYAAADIFIQGSLSEGMSNSLLQAMSCGLACVGSDIPANKRVLNGGKNGLFFKSGQERSLEEALVRLIKDKWLREKLSYQARVDAEKNFSIDKVADSYISLYKEIIS